MPALFLLGERSPLLHVERTRARVEELMPHALVEVMPDTRHGPSIERPDQFNDRVLDFVATAR